MGSLKLQCLIEGQDITFPITAGRDWVVGELKEVIQSKRALDTLKDVGAHTLELWKPTDGNPVRSKPRATLPQRAASIKTSGEKLDAGDTVSSIFRIQPSRDLLHILIEKPTVAHTQIPHEHPLHQLWMLAKVTEVTTRPVQRDESPTETKLPSHCVVLNVGDWIQKLQPDSHITGILIRDEYKKALQSIMNWFHGFEDAIEVAEDVLKVAEDAMEVDDVQPALWTNPFIDVPISYVSSNGAFVLVGNPGIGKTQFLSILLFLRLQAGLPTIYQSRDTHLYYFGHNGVSMIHLAGLVATDFKSHFHPSTWCLIDSNQSVGPVPMFIQDLDLFIVQASSPRLKHFDWMDKAHKPGVQYFMETWTLSELLVGRVLQRSVFSEAVIESFSNRYGTSARSVYTFAGNSQTYENKLLLKMRRITYEELDKLFKQSYALDMSENVSHQIILLSPGFSRDTFRVSFPTQFIYETLRDSLSNHRLMSAARLYDSYVRIPQSRANAGFMLEDAVNDVFSRGGEWSLVKMVANRPGSKYTHWKSHNSTASTQYLHLGFNGRHIAIDPNPNPVGTVYQPLPLFYFMVGQKLQLENGYYWPSTRFQATFDAFIYESAPATATILQVTTSSTHSVKQDGIKWLQELGVQKFRYIAVSTPEISLDLPFPNELTTTLIPEKYLLTVESLPGV